MKFKLSLVILLMLATVSVVAVREFSTNREVIGAGNPGTGDVGYWPLEEGTGSTTIDYSGNSNTGTLTNFSNSPTDGWVTTGKFGNAINFDGVNDYVNVGNANASLRFTGNGTVAAWVKLNSSWSSTGQIFRKQGDGVGGPYEWGIGLGIGSNRTVGFAIVHTDGTPHQHTAATSTILATDTWYHIVGVWNSPVLQVYINGVQDVTTTIDAGTLRTGTTQASCVGISNCSATLSSPFNGLIDEVRVYNRALSAAEIQTLFGRTSRGHGVSR